MCPRTSNAGCYDLYPSFSCPEMSRPLSAPSFPPKSQARWPSAPQAGSSPLPPNGFNTPRWRSLPPNAAGAQQQVQQHSDGARVNGSFFAPPVDLIGFTFYGADKRTQESEFFSNLAWSVPTLVPKHNSKFRVFRRTICWLLWSINIYQTFGRKKVTVFFWNVVLLAQKQA